MKMFVKTRVIFLVKQFVQKKNVSPLINNYSYSTDHRKIIPLKLSDIGEGINEVILKEWHVKVNDYVHEFDNICEVQSDKASVTISSRYQGTIFKLNFQPNDIVKVGSSLLDIQVERRDPDEQIDTRVTKKFLATPAVRKIIKDKQIDINDIEASRNQNRILKEDVLKIGKMNQEIEKVNDRKIQPLSSFQKAMAKKMTEALMIPHFVYSDEINVTKLIELRNELSSNIKDYKFTFMPLLIKALSNALISYPILNSIIDANCDNIIFKSEHNIGIATDTGAGLVVPVIQNVQNKTIFQIAKTLNEFHEKKLNNSWTQEDLCHGTITLSNIGSIGGTYMKPIILPPQVVIGALGRIYSGKGDETNKLLNISWAADHRILDGGTIARFSNFWKKQIENPTLLLTNYYGE